MLIPAVGTLHIKGGIAGISFFDHLRFETRVNFTIIYIYYYYSFLWFLKLTGEVWLIKYILD